MTPAGSRWSGLAPAPVQIAGVINAYSAMLAQRAGFPALYLSGSGVATASFGLPDLGLTTLTGRTSSALPGSPSRCTRCQPSGP